MESSGLIKLEYSGELFGPITFMGSDGRIYHGGIDAEDRFADVDPADVDHMLATGQWKRASIPDPVKVQSVAPRPKLTQPAYTIIEPEHLTMTPEAETGLNEFVEAQARRFVKDIWKTATP